MCPIDICDALQENTRNVKLRKSRAIKVIRQVYTFTIRWNDITLTKRE